jgi:hypothetical protein
MKGRVKEPEVTLNEQLLSVIEAMIMKELSMSFEESDVADYIKDYDYDWQKNIDEVVGNILVVVEDWINDLSSDIENFIEERAEEIDEDEEDVWE